MRIIVAAVIRDEAEHVREWVAWHRVHGVTEFWLWDHHSRPEQVVQTRQALEPYLCAGVVRYQPWTGEERQFQGRILWQALQQARGDADWLALIDPDEFLLPTGEESLVEVLTATQRQDEVAGLGVHWAVFGDSGHQVRQPSTVQAYTRRAERHCQFNHVVKVVVRPECIGYSWGHWAIASPGQFVVNTVGRILPECRTTVEEICWRRLRLNHYVCRSAEDWRAKRARGYPGVSAAANDKREQALRLYGNTVEDRTAWRWLAALQEELTSPRL